MTSTTLLQPRKLKEEKEELPRWEEDKKVWKSRIVSISSFMIGGGALAGAIYFENRISSTLLALLSGMAFQNSAQTALPRKWANKEKSFFGDYFTAVYLITSQVYLNTSPSPVAKEAMLTSLVVLGGIPLSAMLHTLGFKRLTEGRDPDPQASFSAPVPPLKGIFHTSSRKRYALGILEVAFGTASIVAGATVKELSLFRDFGIIVASDGVGQIGAEAFYRKTVGPSKFNRGGGVIIEDPSVRQTTTAKAYRLATKILMPLAHTLPGVLIVAAGSVQKEMYPLAASFYALYGVFNGIKSQLEKARFYGMGKYELLELDSAEKGPRKCYEYAFLGLKYTVAVATLAYIALGISGYDLQTGEVDQFSDADVAALTTFGTCLYGSFVLTKIARKIFDREKDSRFLNEFYFHTCYSIGPPTLALYLLEKMKIGDESLNTYPIVGVVAACIAYASLGGGIGQEAGIRGAFPHPRIFSALPAALLGKFVMRKILGEV